MWRTHSLRLAILLTAASFLTACTDEDRCAVASDMTEGVRITLAENEIVALVQGTHDGLITKTIIDPPPSKDYPNRRVTRAGILLVEDGFEDGRKVDFIYDENPVFPALPIPQGEYRFLGRAEYAGMDYGYVTEFLSEGHYARLVVESCTYETQIIRYSQVRTWIGDGQPGSDRTIARFYLSRDLGFPLRMEFFEDDTLLRPIKSETVARIQKASVPDVR